MRHEVLQSRSGNTTNIHIDHIDHCLEYLRQTIMCAGDTTLERELAPLGLNGEARTCRDWQQILDFAEAHKFKDYKDILN